MTIYIKYCKPLRYSNIRKDSRGFHGPMVLRLLKQNVYYIGMQRNEMYVFVIRIAEKAQ